MTRSITLLERTLRPAPSIEQGLIAVCELRCFAFKIVAAAAAFLVSVPRPHAREELTCGGRERQGGAEEAKWRLFF